MSAAVQGSIRHNQRVTLLSLRGPVSISVIHSSKPAFRQTERGKDEARQHP
jgi:hypothetical protein